jgi:hypothetical protein
MFLPKLKNITIYTLILTKGKSINYSFRKIGSIDNKNRVVVARLTRWRAKKYSYLNDD